MKKLVRWFFDNVVPVLEHALVVTLFLIGVVFTTFPIAVAVAALITIEGEWCSGHTLAAILLCGTLVSLVVSIVMICREYKLHGLLALDLGELFPHLLILGWWWVVVPIALGVAALSGIETLIDKLREWSRR